MDSQVTLIDAPSPTPSEDTFVLVFDRDDMRNTTLRIRGTDHLCYSVDTLDNITTICARDRTLATVTRRKFRPDQIIFPGSTPTRLGRWLKAPILCSSPLQVRVCGKRFEWRDDPLGYLVLRESSRASDALAWFSKSRWDVEGHLHSAYLAIKTEMIEMGDVIVLSCLLAEHKLRAAAASQGKTVLDTMILGF